MEADGGTRRHMEAHGRHMESQEPPCTPPCAAIFKILIHVSAGLLEHALVKDAPAELHVAAFQAVLEVAADAPDQFAAAYKTQLPWLKSYLSHTDAAGMRAHHVAHA